MMTVARRRVAALLTVLALAAVAPAAFAPHSHAGRTVAVSRTWG